MKTFLMYSVLFFGTLPFVYSQMSNVALDYHTEKVDSGNYSYLIHIVNINNYSDSTVYVMYSDADKFVVFNVDTIIFRPKKYGFYNESSLDTIKRKLNYYLTGPFTFSGPPCIPFKNITIGKNEKKVLIYYENHVPSINSTNHFLIDFFVFIGRETYTKYGENKYGFTYIEKYIDKKNIIGITKFFIYDKGILKSTDFELVEIGYKMKGFRAYF